MASEHIICMNKDGHAATGYLFKYEEKDGGVQIGFSGSRDRALRVDPDRAQVMVLYLEKHQQDKTIHYGSVPA